MTEKNRTGQSARRKLIQAYKRIEKTISECMDDRNAEKKSGHIDNAHEYTEAVFFLKQAEAHLRVISRHKFGAPIEDLLIYIEKRKK